MRRDTGMRERYWAILSYTGFNLILVSTLMIVPLFALFGWPGEWTKSIGFFLPALGSAGIGMILWRFFEPRRQVVLTVTDAGIIVFLTWALISLFSALPYMIVEEMTFTQSVFEAVSGWTTTGLTMVVPEETSNMILLWRSTTQLAGGAGFAIMMLAAITGPVGLGFSEAEGRAELLAPHIRESAKLVVKLYMGYVLIGVFAYIFVGLTLFDAVNHTFTAVATGGFSTHSESIGYWGSARVEAVTLLLMFLGNLNFLTAYWLFRGKFRSFLRNGEIRLFFTVTLVSTIMLFFWTTNRVTPGVYGSKGLAFRAALFEGVSALTGTGFTTTEYSGWSGFGWLGLIILMIIGGGICSTSGGLKQYRVYLLLKSIWWQVKRPLLPRNAIVHNYIWKGRQKEFISDLKIKNAANYVFLYLLVFFAGSMILGIYGHGMKESMFEFASALGTVGLSAGITRPDSPLPLLWTEIIGMFLGRLEFFVVFVGMGKIVRDIFNR